MKYLLILFIVLLGSVVQAQDKDQELAVLKAENASYKAQIAKLSQKPPTLADYLKAFEDLKASLFAQACKTSKGKVLTIRLASEVAQGCLH